MWNLDDSHALTNIRKYKNKKQMDFLILGLDLKMEKKEIWDMSGEQDQKWIFQTLEILVLWINIS